MKVMICAAALLLIAGCDASEEMSASQFSTAMAEKMCEIVEDCSPITVDSLDECQSELYTAWLEYADDAACTYSASGAEACYNAVSDDSCNELYDDALAALDGYSGVWLVCDGYAVCSSSSED